MKRIDLTVSELCQEIDDLVELAIFWENKYKEINAKYNNLLDETIKTSQITSFNVLKAVCALKEEPKCPTCDHHTC